MEPRVMEINREIFPAKLKFRALMALFCYRVAAILTTSLLLPMSPILGRYSRRVKDGFNDFLGLVPIIDGRKTLWIHGVSMGESMVAAGFALELQRQFPQYQIVFSTTHPDVLANVKKRGFAGAACYFPLDNYFAMRQIFARWRPHAVFVAETDFWPEFSFQCRQRQIPLVLINGRISDKLARFYGIFPGLAQLIFQSFTLLAVQSQADAQRLLKLGADPAQVKVFGNLKADFTADASSVDLHSYTQWLHGRRCLILGSIHPDEFVMLKPIFARLIKSGIVLIIAPRNPANAEKWGHELVADGLQALCRSKISEDQSAEVLLLDTMGELSALYALADVALVGGSLTDTVGGHNPLEVIQQRVPLIMGPYCRNFADLTGQLLSSGAMISCKDADEILAAVTSLWQNPQAASLQVEKASAILAANRGALEKTLSAVSAFL